MSNKRKKQIINYINEANLKIDYDKLADAIVRANEEVEHIREAQKETKRQEIAQKKKEILHEKDYSYVKYRLARKTLSGLNSLSITFRLLFISKKNAEFFPGVMPLTKTLALGLLAIIKFGFYALTAMCVYMVCQNVRNLNVLTWIMGAIGFFILARMVRIAGFEIDNMENGTELMTTAMLLMTVFTVAFTAISTILAVMGRG